MADEKKIYHVILKLLISIGLLTLLFYKTDIVHLKRIILSANPLFIFYAFILYLLTLAISTYRWSTLLFSDKFKLSYWRLLSLYLIGMFFNNFMPTALGGDLVRCYYLFKDSGSGGASVASVFLERYSGVAAMTTLLFIASIFAYPIINGTPIIWIALIFIIGFLLSGFFIWNKRLHDLLLSVLDMLTLKGLKKKVESFTNALIEYRGYPKVMAKIFFLSLIMQMISIYVFFVLSRALSLNVPLFYFFIFVPVAMAVSMVPFSLAGLGIREGAFVYLFSIIGTPSASALSLSILWFSIVLLVGMWGGVEYVRMGRVDYEKRNT